MLLCGIATFMLLGIKLFQLQVLRHDEFQERAIDQQTRSAEIKASRGTIFDRNGKPLAVSAPAETVYLDPYMIELNGKNNPKENASDIADALSVLLDVERDSIYNKAIDSTKRGLPIKLKIEGEEARAVREYIVDNKLRGVYLLEDSKRYYPQSTLASSVIGFVGTENKGLEGIEAKFDDYLTGLNGRIVRLKNVSGTDMLFSDYENYFDAQNGGDITLTLDSTIQYFMEKHLTQGVADYEIAEGAAAIAVNPKNMEILGIVTLDNFDLNAPFDLPEEFLTELDEQEELTEEERAAAIKAAREAQWRNRVISDTYEPGSVFKTITLAIALEEGLINEQSTFVCNGVHRGVPGRDPENPVHCWNTSGHGTQTLTKAVQNSCNVAFVEIGLKVGAERFYDYIEAFGFRNRTGVDLPGETSSILWSEEAFIGDPRNRTELAAASFGQTFNITPIQLVTAISASVNGGYMYQPHIVQTIRDANGNIVKSADSEPLRQVISESTSRIVRSILEDVVTIGTGKNARVPGYRVGGKTGTTTDTVHQVATGGDRKYTVSFCGIAPMDDPQIVILVLLNNPRSTTVYTSGGAMAAPTVSKMLADILPYLGIAPQYTEDEAKQLNISVPQLRDMPSADAKTALEEAGLAVKTVGNGEVVTGQFPSANAVVAPGTKVIIYLGTDMPQDRMVVVPSLTDRGYYEAKNMLEELGLFIRSTGVPAASDAAVSVQSVPANTEIEYGSIVEVTLVDKSIQGRY